MVDMGRRLSALAMLRLATALLVRAGQRRLCTRLRLHAITYRRRASRPHRHLRGLIEQAAADTRRHVSCTVGYQNTF